MPSTTELDTLRAAVRDAQAALAAAEAEYETAQAAERRERRTRVFENMMARPDSDFRASNPHSDERGYVLPFTADSPRFNPMTDAGSHEYGEGWTANMTAIICRRTDQDRTRPTRLIWTNGYPGVHDAIGQRFTARHDQTGARLGDYEIVGLAMYGPDGLLARTVGDVPSVKFAQSTYK